HLAYIVEHALRRGICTLEVSEEAEAEWVAAILQRAEGKLGFAEQCTPSYYNEEGRPGKSNRQNFFFMGGPTEFVEILEKWRAEGGLRGLELRWSGGSRRSSDPGGIAMAHAPFDPRRYRWREVTGDPALSCKVRHDYAILGYDLAAGTLDMLVRW